MKKILALIAIGMALYAENLQAQLPITDFSMYTGNGGPGTTNPGALGYGVILGSSSTINNGSIGSQANVQTTGGTSFNNANIHSGGRVVLANGNTVSGRITAANTGNLSGNILQVGSSANLSGNIDVNGNILVSGGTVTGIVTHPYGTTYSGPAIGANNVIGTPNLPVLPTLPTPIVFPAAGATNITNTQTIMPGSYGNVTLGGNKTLTLNAPGVYVFNALNFTSNNKIVYNFLNQANGVFRVYVHGDANLAKLNVQLNNGGSAMRIYWEIHGTGSSSASGKDAVTIANGANGGSGSVKFSGTIYAPYAAISLGSGAGSTQYTGTLYSGTQIVIQTGVTMNYSYFTDCATVTATAGNDVSFCPGGSAVLGAAPVVGRTYSWSPATGLSSSTVANPTVTSSTPGVVTYTLTVTQNGCSSTDQVNRTVHSLPVVNAGTYSAVCIDGAPVSLTGTPSGGSFSGAGVSGSTFTPSTAGVGTQTITYTYTDGNGCTNSANASIVVNALPVVSAGSYAPVCLNSSVVTLSGTPSGGTFSGTGVSGSTFDPAVAGAGSTTITYNYSNGQCSNSTTASIQVNTLPDADAGLDGQMDCSNLTTSLNGSSTTPGALYSWVGSLGGNVSANANTATPTVDAHGTFTLTVTDPSTGCTSSDEAIVIFDPCIFPGYDPLNDGKTDSLIGSELVSLYQHWLVNGCSNPNLDVYITNDNCEVLVEIVYAEGMRQTLYNILVGPPYNITDTIENGPNNRILTTFIDIEDLMNLNNLNITMNQTIVNHVRPVYRPIPTAGVAYSLGDVAQRSDLARNGFSVGGEGIKVGVISNSYNTIPGNPANLNVLNGDLPGTGNPDGNTTPVQLIGGDYPYGVQTDEGRAMLQIVHDVAPKAELAFASGFISAGNMAQKIRQLQVNNCDIGVDDITYITEPFFRDGMIATAVNDVTALGMTYFTAAGNYGDKSYEGIYTPIAPPSTIIGTAHDFGGGDKFQNISLTPGQYLLVLQWEDDFYSIDELVSGTDNDLDIYMTYNNGITLFGFNRNNIGGDPIEVLPFTVTQNTTSNILVTRETGTGTNVHFKYLVFKVPANGFIINEYNQGNSTVVGQANSLGAISCGAVLYSNTPAYGVNPPTKASFSSIGGTLTYGTQRNKPDLCAPNGANTTVDLGGPNIDLPNFPLGDAFPNFYGTSAAAPHAAGIGALLQSARQKYYDDQLTPAQIRTLLTSTATDMYTPGFDYLSGYGLVNADAAIRTFAAPTPVLVSLDVPNGLNPGDASFTLTVTADFITTETQIVFREETLATTYIDANHLSAVIPSFFGNPPIQICTPPIAGPEFLDGGCSNILYFFSPIKKEVVVSADNKSKLYGEQMPAFTATVTVDGQSLQDANLTLEDLGLENIIFNLPAGTNSMSDVGIYFINPSAGPFSEGLLELYNYTFNTTANNQPGLFTIGKMPLTIAPQDKTVLYGDKINGTEFEYDYIYNSTNIAAGDQADFLQSIKDLYEPSLVKEVVLIDDRDVYNNETMSVTDLVNLAFMSGSKGIANGSKGIANGSRAIANNLPFPDTTYVVDITYESLVNYNIDGSLANLEDSVMLINGSKGIANGSRGIANSMSIVDGTALMNGSHAIANGSRAIANGSHGIVNSEELDGVSNSNTAVILHETDIDTEEHPDSTFQMISINGITGLTAGTHWIIPGGFMSYNFIVTYDVGTLTVDPFEIVVDAENTTTEYGTPPVYPITISGYQYDDTQPIVFNGTLSAMPDPNSQINVGSHTITPSGLSLVQPSNYYITFVNGTLNVTAATLIATADDKSRAAGVANPPLTISYSGFKYSDDASAISPAINISTTATIASPPGTYPITLSGGSAANYNLTLVNGTLTVVMPSYCSYLQSYWSNPTATSCDGTTSAAMLPGLLTTTLVNGDGSRQMNVSPGQANCLQSKLPAGHTNGQLPNGIVTCATATGTGYLNNGKFRSNLLGQKIALALSVRHNPALGSLNITGPYVTTWAATSCSGGTTVAGTRQVYAIPQSVVTYLGANNTVNDLLVLANKGLGSTLPGGAPSLADIANACLAITTAFDHCRILAGFTTSSAGARMINGEESDIATNLSVYPNPATSTATVSFAAFAGSHAVMELFAVNGERISTLFDGTLNEDGVYNVAVDCNPLVKGIYFVRLTMGEEMSVSKLVIIK